MSKKNWLPSSLKIKISQFWRSYRRLLIIGVPLLTVFLLVLPIMKKDWLAYPAPLRAEIALKQLLADEAVGVACRETCQKQRQQYLNLIFRGGEQMRPKITQALIASSTNSEIRHLLISGWQGNDWKAPGEEVVAAAPSLESQAALIEAWPELAPANWWLEISDRFYASEEDGEKILILANLRGRGEPIAEELIEEILKNSDYSETLQGQAYFLWANLPNKEKAQTLIPLTAWQEILLNENYPETLKEMIIWGLAPSPDLGYDGEESKKLLKMFLTQSKGYSAYLSLAAETVLLEWLKLIPDPNPEAII